MELDTLTPDLPELLLEMGIKYDPDKLARQLSSRWPQVRDCHEHVAVVKSLKIVMENRNGEKNVLMCIRCLDMHTHP
jgi:hypothetical protein